MRTPPASRRAGSVQTGGRSLCALTDGNAFATIATIKLAMDEFAEIDSRGRRGGCLGHLQQIHHEVAAVVLP